MRASIHALLKQLWIESKYSFDLQHATVKLDELLFNYTVKSIQTPHDLLCFLTQRYKIRISDVRSPRRFRELVHLRQIYCYLARTLWPCPKLLVPTQRGRHNSEFSLRMIGIEINRDYTTVISSIKTLKNDIQTNTKLHKEIQELINETTALCYNK